MIFLGVLLFVASALASPYGNTLLNLYGFSPGEPQTGAGHGSSYFNPFSSRRYITLRDVYERPVIVVAGAAPPFREGTQGAYGQPARPTLTAFYARDGISSLPSNAAFKPFYEYLRKHNTLNGLVFSSTGFPYKSTFLQNSIDGIIFPDDFNVRDLLDSTVDQNLLVLYVAPEADFKHYGFSQLVQVATFGLNDKTVVPNSYTVPPSLYPFVPPYYFGSHFTNPSPFQQKPSVQASEVNSKPTAPVSFPPNVASVEEISTIPEPVEPSQSTQRPDTPV